MPPTVIELTAGTVKSARADLVKRKLTITIDFLLTEEVLALRRDLAIIAYDETPVDVTIEERQRRFFIGTESASEMETEATADDELETEFA